jgi:hypothetical protein
MAIPLELSQVAKTLTYTATNGRKVGIGTTVEISGSLKFSGPLYDSYNNVGLGKSVLTSTGVGVSWTTPFAAGLQGTQGTQGTQGLGGSGGTQGLQGTQGSQGLQGTQGTQGTQGLGGSGGTQGLQGLQGRQGTQGLGGSGGTQGTQGRQGTQGTIGFQGIIGSSGPGSESFVSGTLMLFQQTAAPTGWTKQTTHNNKALRVVTGTASSGGTTAFTTVFASRTPAGTNSGGAVSNHTLTTTQISSHQHSLRNSASFNLPGGAPVENINYLTNTSTSELTGSTGGGGAHNHGFTNPTFTGTAMDFAVQYVDVIIASKN